ncbi:hypothetical protein F4804DRAFT_300174 [Jackrogersella minutella]|nr:hypothetical protein F4804DRAFT_300174 [Jackrogersella minutella]
MSLSALLAWCSCRMLILTLCPFQFFSPVKLPCPRVVTHPLQCKLVLVNYMSSYLSVYRSVLVSKMKVRNHDTSVREIASTAPIPALKPHMIK